MTRYQSSFQLTYRRVPLIAYGLVTWVDGVPIFEADRIETQTGQENLYWLLDEAALIDINNAGTQKHMDDSAALVREFRSEVGRSEHA